MTWLGEWLKHVILIVLVSVIADMLLPTKSTQKYVRAVLGIAVIAALLQPITPWFSKDWADQVAQAASNELTESTGEGTQVSERTDLQNYERQLQTQETDQADALLEEATMAAIPVASRQHIVKLTIYDATLPSGLQVSVIVDTPDPAIQQSLKREVAAVLDLQPDQVTTQTRGTE